MKREHWMTSSRITMNQKWNFGELIIFPKIFHRDILHGKLENNESYWLRQIHSKLPILSELSVSVLKCMNFIDIVKWCKSGFQSLTLYASMVKREHWMTSNRITMNQKRNFGTLLILAKKFYEIFFMGNLRTMKVID